MSAAGRAGQGGRGGGARGAEPIEPRREFERDLLYGEAIETVAAMLETNGISQRELADRLRVSEARISRVLTGRENTTLNTIADLGWALGIRFAFAPIPFEDRAGTPAEHDPPPPRWLSSQRRLLAGRTKAEGPPRR
jgi:transcriptional regulator with XRE-family HTH domain